jgi:carboxymethylenebutenolidase
MPDELRARTTTFAGDGGDEIEAYLAEPVGEDAPFGGVVVIHHFPGYDEATKEITRRFAAHRYLAVCPNLYHREAPGAQPDDAAAVARANGGVPDERLLGDVAGAAAFLRSRPSSNGRVGVIGYCSGGRQAFLAACRLPLQAAVDCYGAFIVDPPPPDSPLTAGPILDLAGDLGCALLGLFGVEDAYPSPAETATLESALAAAGKDAEFHTYQGAGHGFFSVDRPGYRPEAAREGWASIWRFFGRHLAT